MTDLKSRTFSLSDEDWNEIVKVAVAMGFDDRKGKAIVQLARERNALIEKND